MPKAPYYPLANRTAQNFQDDYPGVLFESIRGVILHTTEGSGWPAYGGGKSAPTLTAKPNYSTKHLEWRHHFPLNRSGRALRNDPGGVLTNTSNVVQVELCGTSDKNGPGMKWFGAPDWALEDLATFLAFMNKEWGVPLVAPHAFLAYPGSYGNSPARMSASEWREFRGVAGHQHVPENSHGDPGALPIGVVLRMARDIRGLNAPAPVVTPPAPTFEDAEMLSPDAIKQLDTLMDAHDAFMIKNRDATVGREVAAVKSAQEAMVAEVSGLRAAVADMAATNRALAAAVTDLRTAVGSLRASQ